MFRRCPGCWATDCGLLRCPATRSAAVGCGISSRVSAGGDRGQQRRRRSRACGRYRFRCGDELGIGRVADRGEVFIRRSRPPAICSNHTPTPDRRDSGFRDPTCRRRDQFATDIWCRQDPAPTVHRLLGWIRNNPALGGHWRKPARADSGSPPPSIATATASANLVVAVDDVDGQRPLALRSNNAAKPGVRLSLSRLPAAIPRSRASARLAGAEHREQFAGSAPGNARATRTPGPR